MERRPTLRRNRAGGIDFLSSPLATSIKAQPRKSDPCTPPKEAQLQQAKVRALAQGLKWEDLPELTKYSFINLTIGQYNGKKNIVKISKRMFFTNYSFFSSQINAFFK